MTEPTDDEIRAAMAIVRGCKHRVTGFFADTKMMHIDRDGAWLNGKRSCTACAKFWDDRLLMDSDEGIAILTEAGYEILRDKSGGVIGMSMKAVHRG